MNGDVKSAFERTIGRLEREMRAMRKVVEHQAIQIQNLSSYQAQLKLEETISKLDQDVLELKDAADSQSAVIKRHVADMVAMSHEMASLKKINLSQRNELHHLGSETMADVSKLKEEFSGNLTLLLAERSALQHTNARVELMGAEIVRMEQSLGEFTQAVKKEVQDQKGTVKGLRKDHSVISSDLQALRSDAVKHGASVDVLATNVGRLSEMCDEALPAQAEADRKLEQLQKECGQIKSFAEDELRNIKSAVTLFVEQMKAFEASFEGKSGAIERMNSDLKKLGGDIEIGLSNMKTGVDGRLADFLKRLDDVRREVDARLGVVNEDLCNVVDDQRHHREALLRELEAVLADVAHRHDKVIANVCERMDELDGLYDDIQERVFEIDKNRKNNLVFYGVKGDEMDPDECERRIKNLMNAFLQVTREIPLIKVSRIWNGPSFRGVKPIHVCFQLFKDKEEILRKSHLLKGKNVYVTEDFSRKVRKHREELLKLAREVRARDPTARCLLHYDRLFVENDVYLYNDVEGKVQKLLMKRVEGEDRRLRTAPLPAQCFSSSTCKCCLAKTNNDTKMGRREKHEDNEDEDTLLFSRDDVEGADTISSSEELGFYSDTVDSSVPSSNATENRQQPQPAGGSDSSKSTRRANKAFSKSIVK